MSEKDNVAVKFVKPWRGYNPKEVAGFPADQAQKLIDGGVAEKHVGAATGRGQAKAAANGGGGSGRGKATPAADDSAAKGTQQDGSGDGGSGTPDPDENRP